MPARAAAEEIEARGLDWEQEEQKERQQEEERGVGVVAGRLPLAGAGFLALYQPLPSRRGAGRAMPPLRSCHGSPLATPITQPQPAHLLQDLGDSRESSQVTTNVAESLPPGRGRCPLLHLAGAGQWALHRPPNQATRRGFARP